MAERKLRTISIDFAENGACFYQPHFCLENLPSKFLPCKLTLWGEEVKMLASFYQPPMVYLDFYRHFTLKKHQILPRSRGKIKKRRPFFQV